MAIKGIEAQLMVTRTADYTKDTSAMQRKNELMHDYLAVQQKVAEAQEKQKVLRTIEPEKVRLHPDEGEGGGRNAGTGGRRSGAKKDGERGEEEKTKPGAVIMSEEHKIDIKI